MKKILILFFSFSIVVGCVIHDDTKGINDQNTSIKISKLNNIAGKMNLYSGGYSAQPIQNQFGSLYSTYFIVDALMRINYNFSEHEIESIKRFLEKEYDNLLNENNTNLIFDLYYYVALNSMFNMKINNHKNEISNLLKNLKSISGSYYYEYSDLRVDDFSEINKISSTYYAVKIEKYLNMNPDIQTIKWSENILNESLKNKVDVRFISVLLKLGDELEIDYDKKLIQDLYKDDISQILIESNQLLEIDVVIELAGHLDRDYEPDELFWGKINRNQNGDGGWGYDLSEFSDEQATNIVIKIHDHYNKEVKNIEGIKDFLLEQKSFFGGFSPMFKSAFDINSTFYILYLNNKYGLENRNIEKIRGLVNSSLDNFQELSSINKNRVLLINDILKFNIPYTEYINSQKWGLYEGVSDETLISAFYYSEVLSEYEENDLHFEKNIEEYIERKAIKDEFNLNIYLIVENIKLSFQTIKSEEVMKVLYVNNLDVERFMEGTEGMFLISNLLLNIKREEVSNKELYDSLLKDLKQKTIDLEKMIVSLDAPLNLADLYYLEKLKQNYLISR
ncbi:hypothetical protein [Paenibacillus sp. KS-LC4]|uniref:hypothetical protein n=1 Tax=Paenibacillus sp. KS-LC4 TaxID=2979727 RepID=UPI0030CB4222